MNWSYLQSRTVQAAAVLGIYNVILALTPLVSGTTQQVLLVAGNLIGMALVSWLLTVSFVCFFLAFCVILKTYGILKVTGAITLGLIFLFALGTIEETVIKTLGEINGKRQKKTIRK